MTFNASAFEALIKDTNFLCDYIDTPYITTSEQFSSADELVKYLQERITECEVIYYHTAIEFLADNDASLCESLGIACEYGYETKNLNSELLATLLLQQKLSEELAELDFIDVFAEDTKMKLPESVREIIEDNINFINGGRV